MISQGIKLGVGVSHNGALIVDNGNAESRVVGGSFSNKLVYGLIKNLLVLLLSQLVILNYLLNGIGKGTEIFYGLGDGCLLKGVKADDDKEDKAATKG